MDPDDALINLLNGVGSYNGFKNTNQKPFLDEAGLPTDSFLQALKHDFSSYTTTGASHQHPRSTQRVHRSNVRNHVTNKASDGSDILSGSDSADEISHSSNSSEFSDDSDNDDESFSTERKISAKREGGPPQNQSFRKHAIESKYDEQLRPRREDIRASQFPFTTSETDICFERENNFRKDRSLKATKNIKDKEKPVRQKRTSQPSEEFRSKNRLLAQSNRSCFMRQKVLSSDNHGAAMVSRVNAPPAAAAAVSVLDEDSDLAKAEADVKIKSLTLRITGQLQTIRVLETQLGELQHSLKLKSLQASQAESRVRLLLEPREKEKVIFLAKSKSKEEARLQQARVGAEDGAERLKVQINVLQVQLADEQVRRQRAEERGRTLKSYVQTAKVQVREEEAQNKELRAAVEALTAKTARYKRECREQATEAAVQGRLAAEKALEASRQVERADRAEASVRHANIEIEKLRDDVRVQKVEAASRQGKLKAALQELDLLRERECARKAETRLRGLGSAEGEIRTAHSEGAKKRQGDKRGAAPASAPRTAATPLEVIPDPDPRSRSSVGSSSNVYASSDAEDDRSVESSTGGKGKGRGRGYVDAAVEQREEGSTPRFRPPSSALTPPRRPHYTIPPSSAVSLSAAGSRHQPLPRHGLSHSYTYESRAESSKVSTLPPSSLSLEVTSSERIPLSSMNHRHDDVSNKTTKQDRSLRSPPAVTSAQYFSDSELQHYERHSSSRSLADQKRQRRDDAKDSYPPRPPLSVSNFASSADPVCDPTPSGSRTKPSSPNHRISYDLDPDRDRDRVGPRGVQSTAERERDKVSKQSTDAACGQDRSVFREPEGTRSSSSSAMQARAEQLASRDKQLISHSASDTIAVARSFLSSSRAFVPLPTSASAPAASAVPPLSASIPIPIPIAGDYTGAGIGIGASAGLPSSRGQIPGSVGARYDRLQNMFERVTGSAAPAAWRDSDSDSSDTD